VLSLVGECVDRPRQGIDRAGLPKRNGLGDTRELGTYLRRQVNNKGLEPGVGTPRPKRIRLGKKRP
jgi:hypothetical protein